MAWELTGNSGTTSANFLGTTDAQPLSIRTNNSERVAITASGNVGVGKIPAGNYRLDVAGSINVTEIYRNGAPLTGFQWWEFPGGISYASGNVVVGLMSPRSGRYRLDVAGLLNADDVYKGGVPLVGSQWTDIATGSISYGGNVGIGAVNTSYKLNVDGAINATDFRKSGASLVSSQWTNVTGGISYGAGNVGIGAPSTGVKLSVVGGGATVNGVAVGTDVPGAIDYPWEYETVGVAHPGMNLRLQSPNSIVFHTGNPPTHRMILQPGGDCVISKDPGNDTTPSLTKIGLQNRSAGGNVVEWALYTAAAGGGWGVNPNGFEIWEYPATKPRLRIYPNGDTLLAPSGGNVGIGSPNPRSRLTVDVPGSTSPISALSVDVQSFGTVPNSQASHYFRVRDIGAAPPNGWTAFIIRGDGNVGIGTTNPREKLDVAGNLIVTGSASKPGGGSWAYSSDIRLKKSVESLKGALDKLLRLRGVSFEWKKPEDQGSLTGPQMGLIAQEVEEVLPEWVDADPNGYKNLTVRGFEALVVEAFKELKADNETLKTKIDELRSQVEASEST